MSDQSEFDREFVGSRDQVAALPLLSRVPQVKVVLDAYPFSPSAKALNCLPFIVHNELGGSFDGACTLGASFMLLNLASEVFDDLQDRDSDLPWASWLPTDAINVALAMTFQAFELLGSLERIDTPRVIQALAGAGVTASVGQNLQSQSALSMADWLRQAREKSGVVMAAGALVGAIAATEDEGIQTKAAFFGMSLGVLSQAVDDVIDLVSADPDKPIAGDNLCVVTARLRSPGLADPVKPEVASEAVLQAALRIIHKLETDTLKASESLPFISERLSTHVLNQGASLAQLAHASGPNSLVAAADHS